MVKRFYFLDGLLIEKVGLNRKKGFWRKKMENGEIKIKIKIEIKE
jgi:hypothetical protein